MTKLEKEIERRLVNIVKGLGGKCLKWVCPGWQGVPDRIILLPGGRAIFVELKRPKGGVVAPMQTWWRDTLERMDFTVWHIYDDHDLNKAALILHQILEEKR